jgi:hypothetical protein
VTGIPKEKDEKFIKNVIDILNNNSFLRNTARLSVLTCMPSRIFIILTLNIIQYFLCIFTFFFFKIESAYKAF